MDILIFVAIAVGFWIVAQIGLGNMILIAWLLLGLLIFSMNPNVIVLFLGVFLPIMVMWETSETKKQSRRRTYFKKEYDQGWEAASQGKAYDTRQSVEWRMGHYQYRLNRYEKLKKRKGNN